MMFTVLCLTEGCTAPAMEESDKCPVCHDRNGFPERWSRSKDQAWLDNETTDEVRLIPIEGPGCNSHPVTPRPEMCEACKLVIAA